MHYCCHYNIFYALFYFNKIQFSKFNFLWTMQEVQPSVDELPRELFPIHHVLVTRQWHLQRQRLLIHPTDLAVSMIPDIFHPQNPPNQELIRQLTKV